MLLAQLLRLAGFDALAHDGYLRQGVVAAVQHHLHGLLTTRTTQHAHLCLVADHRESYFYRISRLQLQRIGAVERSHSHLALLCARHRRKLNRVVVLVNDLTRKRKRLCACRGVGAQTQYLKYKYFQFHT